MSTPEPVDGAVDRSLGSLRAPLLWLGSAQGGWPPRPPAHRVDLIVAEGSLDTGVARADELADGGCDLLVLASNADPTAGIVVIAALLDLEPVAAVGTVAGPGWAERVTRVRDGLRACRPHLGDPAGLLDAAGEPALSQLTGLLAQCAVRRTPVVLDGSTTACAAALVAERLAPGGSGWWLAGQAPPEPAARRALDDLGLTPLLELGLALPEGAGLAADVLLRGLSLLPAAPGA